MRPPATGPIKLEIFNRRPPSVTAEESSASDTKSGTIAAIAGPLKAKPIPTKGTPKRSTPELIHPSQTVTLKQKHKNARPRLIKATALVRFIKSAITPAGSVHRKNASEVTTGIKEIKKDERSSEFINHTAAVL